MRKNLLAVRLGVALLTCLLLVTFTLSSCGEKAFIAVYPKEYTPYYFYQNYVQCDPNLIHLSAAKNSAGKLKHDPDRYEYYAIKDVPVEEYVCYSHDFALFDPEFTPYIARNSSIEMTDPEVLTWTVTSAELYWRESGHFDDGKGKMLALGEEIYYINHADVDGAAFQAHLRDCMADGDYREVNSWNTISRKQGNLRLCLRLHFAEYENIVWDGMVTLEGDDYFVLCHVWTLYENLSMWDYRTVLVPLPAEIAELIPEV